MQQRRGSFGLMSCHNSREKDDYDYESLEIAENVGSGVKILHRDGNLEFFNSGFGYLLKILNCYGYKSFSNFKEEIFRKKRNTIPLPNNEII